MAVVVALDAGTTGVRALAIDHDSNIVGFAYQEFEQHFPQPGWVEHDASEIWSKACAVLEQLADQLKEPIATIGITNQRETVVAWDRSNSAPLHNAIVWQDRRTASFCTELADQGHADYITDKTGLGLDPYFSATKMNWLLNEGGLDRNSDLALGTIDSWLLWKLTDGATFATEPTNASRTLLFDIEAMCWSQELCDIFDVPMGALAEVRPSSGQFGVTTNSTALGAGIPITGIAGDQQAALFGQACFEPGMTKNTYGTGSFLLMNVGSTCPKHVEGLLRTVAWQLDKDTDPVYAYEGSIFVTGAAIQWLRDGIGIIKEASELGPLAETVDTTGDVYFVPAFVGLGSPWWDPYARGTIVGITAGTGRAELARATVESMAYQVRGVLDIMSAESGLELSELRVDGGASVMDLLLQLQADQLGVRVTRPKTSETTALGAAYLAGLAVGFWAGLDEVRDAWQTQRSFEPSADRSVSEAAYRRWLHAVERSQGWAESSG